MKKIEKTLSLNLKHKRSGKIIPVEVQYTIYQHGTKFLRFRSFNAPSHIKEVQGKKCIALSSTFFKDFQKEVSAFFGIKLSKSNVNIEISDDSWDEVQTLSKEVDKIAETVKNEFQTLADQQPTYYVMYEFLDWGDYSIHQERDIIKMRKALPGEENDQTIEKISFWDGNVRDKGDEWSADFKSVKGDKEGSKFEISTELAQKWIAYKAEFDRLQAQEQAEEERRQKQKAAAREAEEKAKFEEAKTTGKAVVLYSYFLSGNDIPRNFREEDSDMGHLYVLAMPDGTTKEQFSHAY
jgi:hypothetical protein